MAATEALLIIGFFVVFVIVTVALSLGVAWVSLRDETHAPKPFREDAGSAEE